MGNVVLYIATSLDGYIAGTDGGVGWLDPFNSTGEDYGYEDFIGRIGANIQGATTYEQVLGFDVPYPYESKSFVVTHRELAIPEGADVELVEGDLTAVVEKAKASTEKDVWLIGGGLLVQAMLRERLIDEMIITLMPVTVGAGIPLFRGEGQPARFRLIDVQRFESGVLILRYFA